MALATGVAHVAALKGPKGDTGPQGEPWIRGNFPQGSTLGLPRTPGIYVVPSANWAETIIGLPEKWPCLIIEEQVPEGSALIRRETVVYYLTDRTYTRVTGGGGEWLNWKITGGDYGIAEPGYDLNTLGAGMIAMRSPEWQDVLNKPEGAGPGLVFGFESSRFTIMKAQFYLEYGGAGGLGGHFWYRTIRSVAGDWGSWVDLTAGGGGTPAPTGTTNSGLANSVLMDQFTSDMGGVWYTGGKGVCAIRIDHGLNNFNDLVRPLLEARNLPYAITLASGRWSATENNTVTPTMVNGWIEGGLCEIWNHGKDAHGNATGLSAITDYWVGGKTELESQMPAAKIYGAMIPGTGVTDAFDGLGSASTPAAISGSTGGQVILGSHAVISGYFPGTAARVLDGRVRQGQGHSTLDKQTLAGTVSLIGQAQTDKRGLQLMLHPSLVNTTDHISVATLEAILDHIVTERDAGRLVVASPYKMMLADSSR